MAFNKDQFIEDLKNMTVLELKEVVEAIEETFGVSAKPVAVAAGAGAGAASSTGDAKGLLWSAPVLSLKIASMSRPSSSEISPKGHALLLDSLINACSFRFWDKKRPQLLPWAITVSFLSIMSFQVVLRAPEGALTPFPSLFLPNLLRPNLLRPEIHLHCSIAGTGHIVGVFP